MAEPGLLNVEGLSKTFHIKSQGRSVPLHAVRNVSFSLASGRTLALVGESGCGKTTTGRLILRLIEPDGGSVRFEDRDLRTLNPRELRSQRRSMQIIFQDPMGSLNPRMTVGSAILEPLRLHRQDAGSAKERLAELLSEVELDPSYARRYPHELSGGQRQRVAIARALALHPKLIVADEPVSALDASIQSQVLNLLARLQASHGIAFLFISHDLAVVSHIADDVAVMYRGEIVEYGSAEQVFGKPSHPYTVALLAAIPRPDAAAAEVRALAPGQPDTDKQSLGCSFASRCQHSMDICRRQSPEAFGLEAGHYSRCWLNKGGGKPSGACHEN